MSTEVSFGAWLSWRRRSLDMTQEQLARHTNCSTSAIRKIEADERRPSPQVARLLAGALNIPDNERELFLQVARGSVRVERLSTWVTATGVREDGTPVPRPSSIPAPATPLVGREAELNHLKQLLRSPECRLLTLTGPGGIGKTRLAIEAALAMNDEFAGGARFISLAPLNDAEFIAPTIAAAVGCEFRGAANPRATAGLSGTGNRPAGGGQLRASAAGSGAPVGHRRTGARLQGAGHLT
jgi:transcriptional regulator with XRE-family HTH domain